jgi:ribulose-phosphate 3-epimerase
MDGHFVPNLTWGPLFINAISRKTNRQLWVHLMVDNPTPYLTQLEIPAGSIISFHIESSKDKVGTIKHIKEKKWIPSIAINPKTPVEELFPFLNVVQQILVMSVEPGFSGQQFLPFVIAKIETLIAYRTMHKLSFTLAMDGGLNAETIPMVSECGIDQYAIGSAIFKPTHPVENIQKLELLTQK